MSVPSRSTNPAGDKSLVTRHVLAKIRIQFLACHCGRTELADHNSTGVVGYFSRFLRCGIATKSQRKHGGGSIACAGNIEDLPRLGRNMMGPLISLKKHHAVFAERDEKIFRIPLLEQHLAYLGKIDIFFWRNVRIPQRSSGGEKRLRPIGSCDGDSRPINQVARVW